MPVRFFWYAAQRHPTFPCLPYWYCAVGPLRYLYAYWRLPRVTFFSRGVGPFFSVCSLQEPKGDGAGQNLDYNFRHFSKKEMHKVPAMIYRRDPRFKWPGVLTAATGYNLNLVLLHMRNFRRQGQEKSFPHVWNLAAQLGGRLSQGFSAACGEPWPHAFEEPPGFANAVRNKALYWPPT